MPQEQRLGGDASFPAIAINRLCRGAGKAGAGNVEEMAAVKSSLRIDIRNTPDIDAAHRRRRNARQAPVEIGGQAKTAGEIDACSRRQNGQRRRGSAGLLLKADQPVGNLRGRAVAACGDDKVEGFGRKQAGQFSGVARLFGLAQHKRPEMTRQRGLDGGQMAHQAAPAGDRIEDYPDLQARPSLPDSDRRIEALPAGARKRFQHIAMQRKMCAATIPVSHSFHRLPALPTPADQPYRKAISSADAASVARLDAAASEENLLGWNQPGGLP